MINTTVKKIAIVTSHPIQYQIPLFRAISIQSDIDLTVYFGCDYGINPTKVHPGFGKAFAWDIPLLDGYKHIFLKSSKPDVGVNDWRLDGPELKSYFQSNQYDAVIVFGWNKVLFWQAIFWAKKYKISLILRAESNLHNTQSLQIKAIKSLLFPSFFKQFDAFMSIGSHNSELYRYYGVQNSVIYDAPYCVDNDFFAQGAINSEIKAEQLRSRLGISKTDTVFLFMAKFVDRKRPLDLINAAAMNRKNQNFHVILVGGGELMEDCQDAIIDKGLNNVHLVGFVNQTELPVYYAAADIFVLPSRYETWGLVLNEAMACGLPGIVSDTCGAAYDMIIDGKTGYSYTMGDVEQLSKLMVYMSNSLDNCKKMGQQAEKHVQNFSVPIVVSALKNILQDIRKK
jgi:glycosyltransferase involved in cell wall biosynthesis